MLQFQSTIGDSYQHRQTKVSNKASRLVNSIAARKQYSIALYQFAKPDRVVLGNTILQYIQASSDYNSSFIISKFLLSFCIFTNQDSIVL